MAARRRPLTELEIFDALDAHLDQHGREPTLDELLTVLGGGSYRTLMKGRDAWFAARQAAAAAQAVPVPEAIRDLAHEMLGRVWDLAREMAEARLAGERQALATERTRLTKEATELADLADRLATELDQVRAEQATRETEWRVRLEATEAESGRLSQETAQLAEKVSAQARLIAELEPHREALTACRERLEIEQRRNMECETALEEERLRVAEAELRARQAEVKAIELAARSDVLEQVASSEELAALRTRVERLERDPQRPSSPAASVKKGRGATPNT